MTTEPAAAMPAPRIGLLRRLVPVVALLMLSPFCAEYLIAYQGPIVSPLELFGGLLITAPLYGTVAVLIRETTRRAGRGWPTILLLSTAFGVIQAGLIDQSLFNHPAYSDGPYWQTLPTLVPRLDVDASQFLVFVGGHVIWSFGAPIAVVEACVPRLADRPWLGRIGLAVVAAVYLAAAAFFTYQLVLAPHFHAGVARLVGTGVVVAALAAAAFALPRRPARRTGRAPRPWLVGCAALVLITAHVMVRDSWGWLGVGLGVLTLVALGALLLWASGRAGWGRRQTVLVAGAPIVFYAVLAFTVDPMGASPTAKYTSSAVVLVAMIALVAVGYLRSRRAAATTTVPADGSLEG